MAPALAALIGNWSCEMHDQNNVFLAIALSAIILITWQYFLTTTFLPKEAGRKGPQVGVFTPGAGLSPQVQPTKSEASPAAQQPHTTSRQEALSRSPRIPIETPRLRGSISLKGGRIDDLLLTQYHETTAPKSPAIELFSPSGSSQAFYAEFGWVNASSTTSPVPTSETTWHQVGSNDLGIAQPVVLVWQNGQGLEFRRTISVDDKYLFTIRDEVENNAQAPVALAPYALISRHNPPPPLGNYLLHEGAIGVLGADGLQELTYKTLEQKKRVPFTSNGAWLGFTDKYWAAVLAPHAPVPLRAEFAANELGSLKTYQADYVQETQTIPPGATGSAAAHLFAGAKEVDIVDSYQKALALDRFDLLIDWGRLWFMTKPMFSLIDYLFRLVGNFGVAILLVTLLLKVAFFPLARKSYASMAKMRTLQPQVQLIRESFANDKLKQQQAIMELYSREKVNPIAGCLPNLIQIPVFFALYKVLFVTIEMRHAPFFGWIKDLSAADPTNVFNLFGLLPYDPSTVPLIGAFLVIGAWPLMMGLSQWVQMRLTPAPADQTQAAVMNWMPVILVVGLAKFPVGLVIYWTWNNLLSAVQQIIVMRKNAGRIGS
jgi:YidC/Oxa1 family membrane protein insertase